jgi:hypothetical protein
MVWHVLHVSTYEAINRQYTLTSVPKLLNVLSMWKVRCISDSCYIEIYEFI